MGAVIEATKDSFTDLVSEGTVLVDVWGTSCQPCLALMPHVERMAEERPDLTVVKLEAPKARRVCINLRVMSLPAFLVFHDGQEVDRTGGDDLTPDGLEAWLDTTVAGIEAG